MQVTVVGYLSLDQIVCPAGRFDDVPGGGAYYCAAAAAVAGASVRLVAKAGEDFPQTALAALEDLGVDTSQVERAPGTSRRSRLVDPSGQQRILPLSGEDAWWEATRRLAPPLPDGTGIFVYTAMPTDVLEQQIAARHLDDLLIADTSTTYARHSPAALLQLIPRLDVFAPSREETRHLLPGASDDEALLKLSALAFLIVQKRGPDGLVLKRRGGEQLAHPTAAAVVVDTTGAGDSVVGALAAGLSSGKSDKDILALCADVAARVIAGVGIAGFTTSA